ncbi:hypothetical protein V1477_013476 [Vespula maculifrons]|uniref:Uncharacterized protein n=1 Tax=Vespula maculifrons TaxID=7453 RepID=A0ABD2BQU5_VESMC
MQLPPRGGTWLSFRLRQENLEIFGDAIHARINEQLIQIYNSFFDFSLKYRVGIVGLERRQQSTVLDRTLQLLVQLLKCYIGIVGFERRTKSGVGPTLRLSLGLRRENLEIFADAIHACINEQLIQIYNSFFDFSLKYRVGIVGLERQQQSTVLDRTLQLLVHLCFGLRRENLEIFADAIHASINEQLIQIYNSFFDFRLKYSVGKVGFGRRQHSRVLDRPFQLLLLLCFGLRRYTLETIADAIHASINE